MTDGMDDDGDPVEGCEYFVAVTTIALARACCGNNEAISPIGHRNDVLSLVSLEDPF